MQNLDYLVFFLLTHIAWILLFLTDFLTQEKLSMWQVLSFLIPSHVLQYPLWMSREYQNLAPWQDAEDTSLSAFDGVCAQGSPGRGLWGVTEAWCAWGQKESNCPPHGVDFRIYAIISFSYFLLSWLPMVVTESLEQEHNCAKMRKHTQK